MIEPVRPLEETDPDLAAEIKLISNGSHPTVKAIHGDYIIPKPIKAEAKVGRNDPCPCGSSKKFKKCCGRK
jgi:uncharacterized protein YecA (UPF0149 family)